MVASGYLEPKIRSDVKGRVIVDPESVRFQRSPGQNPFGLGPEEVADDHPDCFA